MFNLKKIEPKFTKLNINQLQRQMSYLTNNNNEEFNDFDINISETDIDAFYFKKNKTIEDQKVMKENLIKKIW